MEAKGKNGLSGRAALVNETWGRHGAVILRAGEVSEGRGRRQLEIAMSGEHYKKWLLIVLTGFFKMTFSKYDTRRRHNLLDSSENKPY
jgi:hypothetical protein